MHYGTAVFEYLASAVLQERYIINATADEYLLPNELVDGGRRDSPTMFDRVGEVATLRQPNVRLWRISRVQLRRIIKSYVSQSREPTWSIARNG